MIDVSAIERLMLGHYTVPEDIAARVGPPLAGKQIAVTGFLIRHPQGPFVFDTGFGQGNDENTRHYTVVRRDVVAALAEKGVAARDVRAIANCHFHFNHGGGNHRFPGVTVLCQKAELENARAPDYTIASDVVDYPDARIETLEGDGDVAAGLRLIPTPGHTSGHQSLVVETRQGRIVLAGQAQNFASEHAISHYARALRQRGEPHADYPAWVDRFAELDPWRVLFAHDLAIWERAPR
ncbi:MAG: N-acyl homoserine lactonase family protein [Chloroflexi bacterium]|nr:N-acyl homoserine lactonase family protein [Chloroflexota bacterium]